MKLIIVAAIMLSAASAFAREGIVGDFNLSGNNNAKQCPANIKITDQGTYDYEVYFNGGRAYAFRNSEDGNCSYSSDIIAESTACTTVNSGRLSLSERGSSVASNNVRISYSFTIGVFNSDRLTYKSKGRASEEVTCNYLRVAPKAE